GHAVDAGCLERALPLDVRAMGGGRYHVTGGREMHWVDLHSARVPRCDCGDHLWRERVCKHMLAAMLREGDERVLRAVAMLVADLRAAVSTRLRAVPRRRARQGIGSGEWGRGLDAM
ncbi:MAG TPA: hypothetical protein VFH27_01775, partial [Longimicrobiaceae bacterium]|nr:hypothetical protein [Longimicrobiaceae bacterium]